MAAASKAPSVRIEPSKFSGHPKYERMKEVLDKEPPGFIDEFDARLGVETNRPLAGRAFLLDAIPVGFRGTLIASPKTKMRVGGMISSTGMRAMPGDTIPPTERLFVLGVKTIKHELFHAWMQHHLGIEKYRSLPTWFHEGTAIYFAENLEDRFKQMYLGSKPERFITDIRRRRIPRSILFYPQFALTIEFIDRVYGKEGALKSIFLQLKEGKSLEGAIQEVAKKFSGIDAFYQQAREYAQKRMMDYDAQNTRKFLRIAKGLLPNFEHLLHDNSWYIFQPLFGRIKLYGKFLQHPDAAHRQAAEYILNECENALRDYSGKVFEPLAHMLLGAINMVQGDYASAAESFKAETEGEGLRLYYVPASYYYGLALYLAHQEPTMAKVSALWTVAAVLKHVIDVASRERWRRPAREQLERLLAGKPIDPHLW